MEQNLAILIADLSGYTALTEAHGSTTAADLVDKFIEITNDCLCGDSHLHSRTGDEVVLISTSADDLVTTAILMMQKTTSEGNFLQLHGGLHYGKILKRNNNYFGTTINLASRIANKANPGTFWCSEEFINALSEKTAFTFHARDKHSFKNLSEEKEMFELLIESDLCHIDPVCRMLINDTEKAIPHPDKKNIFFCSAGCLEIYTSKSLEGQV
ncbi:MAG TPA: adenylate/guanylate cyclase domain-containing protein [Bacteroidia bacterium]|nr:adenylate/guanylate cyclase domain-containing protein [Bacteroidia bacterium]